MEMINDARLICHRNISQSVNREKFALDHFRTVMVFDEIKWNLMNFNEF